MRPFLWLGVFFLSTSWLFFIPQYTLPNWTIGIFLILLGLCCMVIASRPTNTTIIARIYLLLLIPLLLSLLFLPFPYCIGIIVLATGILFAIIHSASPTLHKIILGTSFSGLILLVQTLLFPFYKNFISHGHRIDLASPVVSFVGSLLGLPTSTNNGVVYIQTTQQLYTFTTTWDKMGFFPWFLLFLGSLPLLYFFSKKQKFIRSLLIFLTASILYLLLRYVIFIYWYLQTGDLSIFWNPLILMISFLPFILLLMKLLPMTTITVDESPLKKFPLTRKHLLTFVLSFLFMFSLIGTFAYHDPGTIKNGRILIDEYHSDWENTTKPLDTQWFGLLSTYNYYSWAEWLNHYYTVERNINKTLTESLLQQYDIVILKCPTTSYSDEEITVVVRYVENGGGLYLIGDHTDVFGMNTFLNQLATRFGFQFNIDATYELGTGNLSVYTPEPLFPHPIVSHLNQFEFMTSCTLQPTSLADSVTMQNIIIGDRLVGEPGTYSTENFFRESVASTDADFSFLLQSAAVTYGKGRVVAFTDSTVFSSFSVFSDGYTSYTFGVIDFLNHTNTSISLPLLFFIIALISLCSLFFVLMKTKKIHILWTMLIASLFAFSFFHSLFYLIE